MTVNTATERSTTAPMPSATATTCAYSPSMPPTAEPTPAARPSISERLITKSTFGPGTAISANEISAKASRWAVGSMPADYPGPGPGGLPLTGPGPACALHALDKGHPGRAGEDQPRASRVLGVAHRNDPGHGGHLDALAIGTAMAALMPPPSWPVRLAHGAPPPALPARHETGYQRPRGARAFRYCA